MTRTLTILTAALALALVVPQSLAQAQYDPEQGDVAPPPQPGGGGGGGGGGSVSPGAGGGGGSATTGGGGGGGVRLGFQGRIGAINVFGGALVLNGLSPFVTFGARLIDGRLFVGAGFGFFGGDFGPGPDPDGFSLSPVFSFDFISDEWGAFNLVGWLNLGEVDGAGGPGLDDDDFFWGMNIGIGVRGRINDGVAIGSEWGWGFIVADDDGRDDNDFFHGIFGTILFEATFGV